MVDVSFIYSEEFWVMIAAIAAAIAAGYAANQAKLSKKAAELQMSSHVFQRLTALYDEKALISGQLELVIKRILQSKPDATLNDMPTSPLDFRTSIAKLRAFYEEVGHYLYYHKEFEERLLSIVGEDVLRIWNMLLPIVSNERKKFGEKEFFFFEYLVNRIQASKSSSRFRRWSSVAFFAAMPVGFYTMYVLALVDIFAPNLHGLAIQANLEWLLLITLLSISVGGADFYNEYLAKTKFKWSPVFEPIALSVYGFDIGAAGFFAYVLWIKLGLAV